MIHLYLNGILPRGKFNLVHYASIILYACPTEGDENTELSKSNRSISSPLVKLC